MCGCAHTCVRPAARVLRPGWGHAGGGWWKGDIRVHVRFSPGGLFRSAECGRVYLISDVPSVFSADINCQTMSNGAQMFPSGGLPSFASAMRVIKKKKNPSGSRVWAATAAGMLLGARGRDWGSAHAPAAPAPAPPSWERGNQGAEAMQSAGGETHLQDLPEPPRPEKGKLATLRLTQQPVIS